MKHWLSLIIACSSWAMPVLAQQTLPTSLCQLPSNLYDALPPADQRYYPNQKPDRSLPTVSPLYLEQKKQEWQQLKKGPSNLEKDLKAPSLTWDEWHSQVEAEIYRRCPARVTKPLQHTPGLIASAAYTVTKDGRIVNARLTKKSNNPMFNELVLAAINSMNGNAILQFPTGSTVSQINKVGTFTQNFAHGVNIVPVGDFDLW